MDVKNLSWEQIKELADMAIKAGNDFSLMMGVDGDCSINISKRDYTFTPGISCDDTITVLGTYV